MSHTVDVPKVDRMRAKYGLSVTSISGSLNTVGVLAASLEKEAILGSRSHFRALALVILPSSSAAASSYTQYVLSGA
jgi:hypothetical protein